MDLNLKSQSFVPLINDLFSFKGSGVPIQTNLQRDSRFLSDRGQASPYQLTRGSIWSGCFRTWKASS